MTRRPPSPRIRRPRSYGLWLSWALFACTTPVLAQAPVDDDVEIEVESQPLAAPPIAEPAPTRAELSALRDELKALAQRIAAAQAESEAKRLQAEQAAQEREARASQERARAAAERDERAAQDLRARIAKLGVFVSGYVQVQYGRNELSEDQLLQGGTPLNQNRFAVRRGRVRVNGRWQYFRTDFELDGSNTRGPTVSVRRASLSGVLPNSKVDAPPLLMLTAGLTEIPLGLELQQGQDDILFLERTPGSLALFAGPVDTGVKLEGAYGPLRLQLAVMNGVPLDDRAGGPSGIDPTSAPDYLGRVGVDTKPIDRLRIAGGASFLSGKGFHAGSDGTKSVLQWDDQNADGQFSLTEVVQVAGRGAIPSQTFDRWAVAADLQIELKTLLGWSRLYGEVTLASNLDRSLYVADPTLSGNDLRELSWYVAFVQDLTEWGFVGVRYDEYDPNSDLVDTRRGQPVLSDARLKTLSPILGVRFPNYARLTFEYDWVQDKLARDRRGIPTDVANNQWTLRAQGQF